MSYFKKTISFILAAAMLAQPVFSAFASDLPAESEVVSAALSSSEGPQWIGDRVFEGDTLPCSQNDPSYHKFVNNNNTRMMRAVWGSGNLTHQDRFDGYDKVFGIDVSYYQYDIDWEKVKAAGIKYAIIRVGYRGYGNGALVLDDKFDTYIQGAKKAGLDIGVYFYTQAINTDEAKEEAQFVLEHIKNYDLSMPVYYDIEGVDYDTGRLDSAGLTKAQKTALCTAFCDTIKKAGYKSGVYANMSWLTYQIDGAALGKKYPVWLAHYTTNTEYTGAFDMWQYTGTGNVDGISTYVDMNVLYSENAKPRKITDLKASNMSGDYATLRWTAVPGCDGYRIYQKNIETGTVSLACETLTNTAKIKLPDENYKFYVRAYNEKFGTANYGDISNVLILSKNKVINLTKTAASQNVIAVKWDPVQEANGYEVAVYDTVAKKYWIAGTTSQSSFRITGLNPGTIHRIKVRPYFNSDGTADYVAGKSRFGAFSEVYRTGTMTAKTQNVRYSASSSNAVAIVWDKLEAAYDGYQIAIYNPDAGKYTVVGSSEEEKYTIRNLNSGTSYYIAVRAYYEFNGVKFYGNFSNKVLLTTRPTAPSGLKCTDKTSNSVTLSWNKSNGATSYMVYEQTNSGFVLIDEIADSKIIIKNLPKNSSHTYVVVSHRKVGDVNWRGARSAPISVSLAPEAPTGISVKGYCSNAVRISWKPVQTATSYYVYLYSSSAKAYKRIAEVENTEYRISGLKGNTAYKVKVKSVYGEKAGLASAATTVYTSPSIPTGVKAVSKTKTSITLSWKPVSGASGYRIYVYSGKGKFIKKHDVYGAVKYTVTGLSAGTGYRLKVAAIRKTTLKSYVSGASTTAVAATAKPVYYPKTSYTGGMLYYAFADIGVVCTFELQEKIAAANGITGYTGTVAQNNKMLSLLKQGKLIKP